jgi:hypothetical protein
VGAPDFSDDLEEEGKTYWHFGQIRKSRGGWPIPAFLSLDSDFLARQAWLLGILPP